MMFPVLRLRFALSKEGYEVIGCGEALWSVWGGFNHTAHFADIERTKDGLLLTTYGTDDGSTQNIRRVAEPYAKTDHADSYFSRVKRAA